MTNVQKRRIITAKECKQDLKNYLEMIFGSVENGINGYNEVLSLFPVAARARALEANVLNSKIIESIQNSFPEDWRFGKYRRFVLRIDGYNILFKKLNNKDLPMNVRTKNVVAIENQFQLNLFDDPAFADTIEPIVFFGYKKDKWGVIVDPKLVYIDEGKIKWTISKSEIKMEQTLESVIPINTSTEERPKVFIRENIIKQKRKVK